MELVDEEIDQLEKWAKGKELTFWSDIETLLELADHMVRKAEAAGTIERRPCGQCSTCMPCAGTTICVHCGNECTTVEKYKLSDAIREEGYEVVIDAVPGRHPDALGDTGDITVGAQVLSGDRIALRADDWGYAYGASHEICEVENGFKHSEDLFVDQCNLLNKWHIRRQGGEIDP
jgi:hypothetical protein